MTRLRIVLILVALLLTLTATRDPRIPICAYRGHYVIDIAVDYRVFCLEEITHDETAGELAFTSLAAGPGSLLYATRPLSGQVFELYDTDGDLLPDSPHVIAEGLTLPNGLAYHDGALYISGGANIYRLEHGQLKTLVDDLPSGGGFWTGSLTIGSDERIYVGIGAPCNFCEFEDAERGAILSFALDGSDRQIVASGLRRPADVAFSGDTLWTVDSARDELTDGDLDELNRVTSGANFGWPYCIGDNQPDMQGLDCSQAVSPEFTFATGSIPLGIAAYKGTAFPELQGALLFALGGKSDDDRLDGFRLGAVYLDETANPVEFQTLMPSRDNDFFNITWWWDINYNQSGFWPHQVYDVTVSGEGWIYLSIGGGRIFALRPPD